VYIGTGRGGRRSKQLLDDLRETRGHWEFKAGVYRDGKRRKKK